MTCPAGGNTTCTLTGLTNGLTYTVVVVAHSAVGDSEPSAGAVVTLVTPQPEKTIPLAPDAPQLGPTSDNAAGTIRINNARLKEGNGYTVNDLELFYADSLPGCMAPGNPVRFNNGDRADFDLGPLPSGSRMTYYFCQRGKRGPNDYVWSPATPASGFVGTGQHGGDGGGGNGGGGNGGGGNGGDEEKPQPPDSSPIPLFTVSAEPHTNSVTIVWTPPEKVSLKETNVWIKDVANTKQTFNGPMTKVTVSGLQPVHQYTAVVELVSTGGAHREKEVTFTTGESADEIDASFTGMTACPNGQECGSMTLTASRASQFQRGKTLVCTVTTGRPGQATEFRFSQGTPSIPGILTESITARELSARQVVKNCRGE